MADEDPPLLSVESISKLARSLSLHTNKLPTNSNSPHTQLDITVGDLVECDYLLALGIVQWIGKLHERQEVFAGVILNDDYGNTDGTYRGIRYFSCEATRGVFLPLRDLRIANCTISEMEDSTDQTNKKHKHHSKNVLSVDDTFLRRFSKPFKSDGLSYLRMDIEDSKSPQSDVFYLGKVSTMHAFVLLVSFQIE